MSPNGNWLSHLASVGDYTQARLIYLSTCSVAHTMVVIDLGATLCLDYWGHMTQCSCDDIDRLALDTPGPGGKSDDY